MPSQACWRPWPCWSIVAASWMTPAADQLEYLGEGLVEFRTAAIDAGRPACGQDRPEGRRLRTERPSGLLEIGLNRLADLARAARRVCRPSHPSLSFRVRHSSHDRPALNPRAASTPPPPLRTTMGSSPRFDLERC